MGWTSGEGNALPRIGVTGHVHLTPDSEPLIYRAIVAALGPYTGAGLVGMSCIARGADSIFAQAVLDLGGRLEVVVPAQDYRDTVCAEHAAHFDALLARAAEVRVMSYDESGRDAYEAASRHLVTRADHLIAVWDGQEEAGPGNTSSAVRFARAAGVPVTVVWPAGATRSGCPAERG